MIYRIIKKITNFTRKLVGTERLEKRMSRVETKMYEIEGGLLFGFAAFDAARNAPSFYRNAHFRSYAIWRN